MQVMATRKGQVTSPHLPRMVLAIVILMLARASHARAGPHIAPNTLWLRSSLASDIYSKVAEDQCIMGPLHDTWRHLDMNANMEACIVPAGERIFVALALYQQ